jgi:hypothetical protein
MGPPSYMRFVFSETSLCGAHQHSPTLLQFSPAATRQRSVTLGHRAAEDRHSPTLLQFSPAATRQRSITLGHRAAEDQHGRASRRERADTVG